MIIPPTDVPIDILYVPDPNVKTLIVGLTFGTPREYDPDTGTVGPEVLSPDIGVYHSQEGYMLWHWDPFVESILNTNPYPQLLWSSRERPYELRAVNRTGKYVYVDATFWLIKFPKAIYCPIYGECDPEDLFRKYMAGVTNLLIALEKVGVERIANLFGGRLTVGGRP